MREHYQYLSFRFIFYTSCRCSINFFPNYIHSIIAENIYGTESMDKRCLIKDTDIGCNDIYFYTINYMKTYV